MKEPELSASESASLERGYRRRLAWYPRWFRRENEDEILAVLLACAVVFLVFNPASSRHYRTSMRNTSSLT